MATNTLKKDTLVILDYSCGEVFIYHLDENVITSDFLEEKGFKESEVNWMRGNDIRINREKDED